MKDNRFIKRSISFLLILTFLFSFGALTVFAEPAEGQPQEQGQQEVVPQQTPQETPQVTPQETPQEDPAPEPQVQPEQQEQQAQQEQQTPETPQQEQPQDQWYDYIYSYNEDAESNYEAPAHLNDLPQASSEQVVEATAVPMPTVAVSDASLFSGIVTWLCVALGIAVVVGVLVSKRTRRRGA